MDRVEGACPRRLEPTGGEQQLAVDDELVERIHVREGDVHVTADATHRPKDLGDRQLAGHEHIVGAETLAPGREGRTLSFHGRELHDR